MEDDVVMTWDLALRLIQPLILIVSAWVAVATWRQQNRLRRLQVLSSFNERLAECSAAYKWIWQEGDKTWLETDDPAKYQYQNYIATFEDIGLAREIGVITQEDFLKSYGGRYRKLMNSGTFEPYKAAMKFENINFQHLEIIDDDIKTPIRYQYKSSRSGLWTCVSRFPR
jgi:hypothetical protein